MGRESVFDYVRINRKEPMKRVIRNLQGPIPDDHFENEPTFPAKNVSPPTKEFLEWMESLKEKYQPDDVVTGY
jgi:hypothetical protein